LVMLRS